MKRIIFIFSALLLLAAPVQAQQDSVLVEVINRTDLTLIIEPDGPLRVFTGDSIQFSATAVDTVSGDTIDVNLLWTSTNPSVIEVDPATGWARFRSRGSAAVVVEIASLVSLIFMTPDDQGFWAEAYSPSRDAFYAQTGFVPDGFQVEVGQERPLCVYGQDSAGRVRLQVPLDSMFSADPSILTVAHDPLQSDCGGWDEITISRGIGIGARLAYLKMIG